MHVCVSVCVRVRARGSRGIGGEKKKWRNNNTESAELRLMHARFVRYYEYYYTFVVVAVV
jgi:hypothetical protein